MRKRIDAYILLDFLEGWRTRLKNDRIIVPNVIWAAKVEQSIKDLSRIIDFVKAHSKTYDNDKERPTEINEQTIEAGLYAGRPQEIRCRQRQIPVDEAHWRNGHNGSQYRKA